MLLYYWIYLTCCEKEIKFLAILTFYVFSSTRLINSIKHKSSCKILYLTCFFMHYHLPGLKGDNTNLVCQVTRQILILEDDGYGFNISFGICWTSMHWKTIFKCYYCINSTVYSLVSQLCRLSFDLCCSLISTRPAKGGAYKIDLSIWWMNKLKGGCFIGHDTSILLHKYSWIYNIRSCTGKLVFHSSRLQERIFVYTVVNCTIKLT